MKILAHKLDGVIIFFLSSFFVCRRRLGVRARNGGCGGAHQGKWGLHGGDSKEGIEPTQRDLTLHQWVLMLSQLL